MSRLPTPRPELRSRFRLVVFRLGTLHGAHRIAGYHEHEHCKNVAHAPPSTNFQQPLSYQGRCSCDSDVHSGYTDPRQ